MNEDFTFERFVMGKNNDFAYNAAIAVSKNSGKVYNPLFIFGNVGMGKTHLMQAIGNYVHENTENKVVYVTSEDFLNGYMDGIAEGKMNSFKNKFRNTDVLLIDDIQFLQGKPGVQDELFHTFNALINAKKALVFTSDRPPSELKKFHERLLSRFVQGTKVDLQPPGYEERYAILKKAISNRKTDIPDEIIDFLSKNISSNVRDLIAALNTLTDYTELMGKPITLEIVQQRLKDVFNAPRQPYLSMDNIIRVVADYFSLTPNDLKGKKKSQNIVFPRQLAMYIGREMTEYSTTELGQEFGGRDHTTVMHSIERIKAKLLTDPSLETTIESIKRSIKEFGAKH
jgi:chromosomal replication initiator protein